MIKRLIRWLLPSQRATGGVVPPLRSPGVPEGISQDTIDYRNKVNADNARHKRELARWIREDELLRHEPVENRERLYGKMVRVLPNPWARQGPTEGIFLGQGEAGIGLRVKGGGRFSYDHHEVQAVILRPDFQEENNASD